MNETNKDDPSYEETEENWEEDETCDECGELVEDCTCDDDDEDEDDDDTEGDDRVQEVD